MYLYKVSVIKLVAQNDSEIKGNKVFMRVKYNDIPRTVYHQLGSN